MGGRWEEIQEEKKKRQDFSSPEQKGKVLIAQRNKLVIIATLVLKIALFIFHQKKALSFTQRI